MTARIIKTARAGKLKKPRLNVITIIEAKSRKPLISSTITKVYHELPFLLIILIFCLIYFLRLFYPYSSIFMIPDFGESDVLHLNLPLKHFLSETLKNNTWPLWTDKLAGGFPLLAEGQIGTFYLPNLVLFKYLHFISAFNLNLLLCYLLSSFGMFLFTKKIGLQSISATFSALFYSYSLFFASHLNHFNLLQAATLLPLLFYSAFFLIKKPRLKFLVFFSFLLSQQIFTGHFYIVFISLVGIIFFFTHEYFKLPNSIKSKSAFYFFISIIFSLLLSAIQILPTLELMQISSRQMGLDFETVTSFPYPLKHISTFISPYFFGSPANGTYPAFSHSWGIFWENSSYLGIQTFIFALLSIFLIKKNRVGNFLLLFILSLLLVLGKNSPLYFLFSLPPFNFFRVPSKFLLLSVFSLSILSAIFIDFIFKRIKNAKFRISVIFIIFLFFIFDEFRISYFYPPVSATKFWLDPPEMTENIKNSFRIHSYGQEISWNEIFLKNGWQNLNEYLKFKDYFFPNYNLIFNLSALDVNTGGLKPKRTDFWNSVVSSVIFDIKNNSLELSVYAKQALNILGIDTLISPNLIKDAEFTKTGKITYKNLNARPKSYFAEKIESVSTVEDLYKKLSNLEKNAILAESDIKLNGNKLLVFNRTWYPGWQLYQDGIKSKVYIVNLNQPAIVTDNLNHKIEFAYNPESFNLGKKISVSSFFIAFLAVFLFSFRLPHKA